MELHFSDELQKQIYEVVFPPDRKWLMEAVEYARRVRRGYPDDFEAWTDDVTIDHILYFVNLCRMATRDATLDEPNIIVAVKQHVQQYPCLIRQPVSDADVDEVMHEALKKTSEVISDDVPPPPKKVTKKKTTKKKTTKKKAKKKVAKKK